VIDTSKPPMVHRIHIPRPYEPSFNTDIRRTFARERDRLARLTARRTFARELAEPGAADVRALMAKRYRDDDNERMYAL
jgi:hypothetical protein